MPNILESKNVLIVPLALFIKYNEKSAAEKFATIFKTMADDLLSNPEESAKKEYFKKQQQFNERSIQKILNSSLATQFKLGNKSEHEFISELLSLLKLSRHNSMAVEEAWNSLIEFDAESSNAFEALIKLIHQGKSIYFIGDMNRLHAKKILALFSCFPLDNIAFLENVPDLTPALPYTISRVMHLELAEASAASMGKVYFCLSYAYKALLEQPSFLSLFFSSRFTPGLLTHLKYYLKEIGKVNDDILLINPYQRQSSILQKLELETISKEKFYSDLLEKPCSSATLTQSMHVNVHPTPPLAIPEDLSLSEASSIHLSATP